jgi:hypothetical protein
LFNASERETVVVCLSDEFMIKIKFLVDGSVTIITAELMPSWVLWAISS